MQIFGFDWTRFFELLPVWRKLSPEMRGVALYKLRGSEPMPLDRAGQALLDAGLAVRLAKSPKVTLIELYRAPMTAMRAMDRLRLFDAPDFGRASCEQSLLNYAREHFARHECEQLLQQFGVYHGTHRELGKKAGSKSWLDRFLNSMTAEDWQGGFVHWGGRRGSFENPKTFAAAQRLARYLAAQPAPVRFGDLPRDLAENSTTLLANAVQASIANLVIFPALRGEDLEPLLWIWPGIGTRIHRLLPAAPAPLDPPPTDTFCSAWLVEDMTTLLVACVQAPLRLRANYRDVFARDRVRVEAEFTTIAQWAVDRLGAFGRLSPSPTPAYRFERALNGLEQMGFVSAERRGRLSALEPGRAWLQGDAKRRLQALLDKLRSSEHTGWSRGRCFDFVPEGFQAILAGSAVQVRKNIVEAFAALPAGKFVLASEFLRFQAESANPLLSLAKQASQPGVLRVHTGWEMVEPTEENLEQAWSELLSTVLRHNLAPFGGVALGIAPRPGEALAFSLTSVGRYLLGLANDFSYAADGQGGLVVQPNFEIVFLAPNPSAEAECGRFAERLAPGQRVGTLFRITRKSVMDAAAIGWDADRLLSTLTAACQKPVSANVEHEIRCWLGQVRQIGVRQTLLVECPDAQTALRVLAAGGDKLARVSDTILELRKRKDKDWLEKKLRTLGIFATNAKAARNVPDTEDDDEIS